MNVDKFIGDILINKFGNDKVERRNYYKLEMTKGYLQGKGKECGIMYLVDVDYDHYIDVNIYKNGDIKLKFRKDDNILAFIRLIEPKDKSILCTIDKIDDTLYAFLALVDEQQVLKSRFLDLSNHKIPTDLIRTRKIDSVLNI